MNRGNSRARGPTVWNLNGMSGCRRRPIGRWETLETRILPSTLQVTSTVDGDSGSLRSQIAAASSGDTIEFDSSLDGATLVLSSTLTIDRNLTITGLGADSLALDGDGSVRVIAIDAGIAASISGLTIQNGLASGGSGGGISAGASSSLSLTQVRIADNTAARGGGVFAGVSSTIVVDQCLFTGNLATGAGLGGGLYVNGAVTVTNSTFSGNGAANEGAAINVFADLTSDGIASASVALTNCTLTENASTSNGGVLNVLSEHHGAASATLVNCTVAGNTGGGLLTLAVLNGTSTSSVHNSVFASNGVCNFDTSGSGATLTDAGYNLDSVGDSGFTNGVNGNIVGRNPLLSSLALYNASLVTTLALLPGSPAIDAGSSSGAPGSDARGLSRVGNTDMGAYESQGFHLELLGGDSQFTTISAAFAIPLSVTVTALSAGEPVNGGQVQFTASGSGASLSSTTLTSTIAGGQAARSVTANGIGGTHTVSATAVGSTETVAFSLTNNQPPSITSSGATTFTTGSAGSFTVTMTGFPAPTVSQSGTLPTGVTFNGNTGVLSGTPAAGTGGSYALDFTASNSVGSDATQSFTLTVNQAPAITNMNAATFTVGSAGTFTLVAAGFPNATLSKTGTLPSGVTFNPGTGELSGTPATGTGGTYTISFRASNGVGSDATQSFTLTVEQPPAITSADAATFAVGSAGSFTLTTTGFPARTLSASGTLPDGVTFDSNTGVLSGTPAAGMGGTYVIDFTASNGVGTDATQSFTLTVNQAAAITSTNTATFMVGAAGSFTLVATGVPGATLSKTGSLPSGVTFNPGTGELSGTPGAGTGGTYAITFRASNGVGADATQSFMLTVEQAPAITSADAATFTVGSAGSFSLTTSGFPARALSESGALPDGVTFDENTGVLSGTPVAGTGGTYVIDFAASNGVGSDATQSFTLNVNESPAITSANAATFTVGDAGAFTLATTGFPGATLSKTGTLPSGVTFDPGTGVLSGTPDAGTGGTYAITFRASNGIGSDATQSFTLTVEQAPAITSADSATFTVGSAGTFTLITTGFPARTLSASGTLPDGVTFDANTGVLSGTPAATTGGTYTIDFTASNGVGTDATQSFTLTVNQAPAITSATAATFTVGDAGSFTIVTTGFPTATLSITGALPDGVAFDSITGELSGTPDAVTGGTYALTFEASNGVGADASQSFLLTVDEAPTITSADAATFTVRSAGTFTVIATGFPAAAFSETGPLPDGITFDSATGVLSGTPDTGTGGTYAIDFTASNSVDPEATQSFTLVVNETPAITSASAVTMTGGAASSFTLTTRGFPDVTWSESGTLPAGVTFDTGLGVLSGTPAAGTGGRYTVSFTASNGIGGDAVQTFTLTVNQAPAITSAAAATFTIGTPGTLTLISTGFPDRTLSVSGALPAGVAFNANTGVLSGVPQAGTGGAYAVIFRAANGVGTAATQTFTLTVNQIPAISSPNAKTFTAGTAGAFSIATTGYPARTITQGGVLPTGVIFQAGQGLLTGTPVVGTGGRYSLSFRATNGVGPDALQSFTLTVNQLPAFTSANSVMFTAGVPGTFSVTTTGFPAATLALTGALPNGIYFNANTGTLSGKAAVGTGGIYRLTLKATNGVGAGATQAFTLTVSQPPSITSANVKTFTVGTPGTFTVTAAGFPAVTLTQTGTLPAGIQFNAKSGTLSGTPAAGTGGTYVLTFGATNGGALSASQRFTLTINQPPTISSAATATFTAGTASSFAFTTTGFPAALTTVIGALPAGMTYNTRTGALSGTPSANSGGTYKLTIKASNGAGAAATQTFTLKVNQPATITSARSAAFLVGTRGAFAMSTAGFPAATFSATGTLPRGVTFNPGTGLLSGTPGAGSSGVYAITLQASNGIGATASQSFTLTVNQAPVITSAAAATFVVGTAGRFTVTSSGFPAAVLSVTGTLPRGVSFNAGTGVLSGIAATGTNGSYVLTFKARNGAGADATQRFTLTVSPPPSAGGRSLFVAPVRARLMTETGDIGDGASSEVGMDVDLSDIAVSGFAQHSEPGADAKTERAGSMLGRQPGQGHSQSRGKPSESVPASEIVPATRLQDADWRAIWQDRFVFGMADIGPVQTANERGSCGVVEPNSGVKYDVRSVEFTTANRGKGLNLLGPLGDGDPLGETEQELPLKPGSASSGSVASSRSSDDPTRAAFPLSIQTLDALFATFHNAFQ